MTVREAPNSGESCDPALLNACLNARELLSLDPSEVLSAATSLISSLIPVATVRVEVLDGGRLPVSLKLTRAELEVLRRATEELLPARLSSGERELLAVPLGATPRDGGPLSRKPALGVALLETAQGALSDDLLEQILLIADRAGLALEHALLYRTQADIARRIQRLLAPLEPPAVDGVQIGVFYRAATLGAEIGGDFYDFTAASPGQLLVAIGDVSGKGIDAVSVTIITKYALRAVVRSERWPTWPGDALRGLNNALQDQLDPARFVTVVLGLIDARRRTLTVSSAGHPGPVVISGRHGVQRPLLLTAPAIALTPTSEIDSYPTERIELEEGDAVVFFTDGISELRDAASRFYDEHRLEQALAELAGLPAQELAEGLAADAAAFSARPPSDDMAVVAVRLG